MQEPSEQRNIQIQNTVVHFDMLIVIESTRRTIVYARGAFRLHIAYQ